MDDHWLRPHRHVPDHPITNALLLIAIAILIAVAAGIELPLP